MVALALAVYCAVVLGSFPSGLVLAHAFAGRDIREHGTGNIGAANVSSTAGLPLGIAVGILDIVKGIVAVLIGRGLGLGPSGLALVAFAAVLGHDFSIFLRFRGGKGVATSFGVALVLTPAAAVLAMLSWLVGPLGLGYASVGSLLSLALLPVYMALTGQDRSYVLLGVALFLLAAARHWENILRLAQGRERRARLPWSRR
jgi:glycerol-3-phosphate acyltransferase PlsY